MEGTSQVTYRSCFEIWKCAHKSQKAKAIFDHILSTHSLHNAPDEIISSVKKTSSLLSLNLIKKWEHTHRTQKTFLVRYKDWLEQEVALEDQVNNYREKFSSLANPNGDGVKRGRPEKDFNNLCLKSKKRRVVDLVHNWNSDELSFASNLSRGSAKLSEQKHLPLLQALSLYLDLGLSFRKYNILRTTVNSLHNNTFPSYYALKKVRDQRLPSNIDVSDNHAVVDFQQLLNKTAEYIIESIDRESLRMCTSLKLICKWGFDGSSGHSLYKQKFRNVDNTDEFVFLIALVPLQVVDTTTDDIIIWKNPTPSSVIYCRPIKFIFTKESPTLVIQEKNIMDKLINELVTFNTDIDNKSINVNFKMIFTMVDGSICNILSETNATQTCYICGCTPKYMNSERSETFQPNESMYEFGLSSLHCWIRTFECLLHISYRLDLKKWQIRGEESKMYFCERKVKIQNEFKAKLGLIVDKPKPGFGSSNDGNTARKFFANPSVSASITGIDVNLILKLSIILKVISSGRKIDISKFKLIINEAKQIYLSNYNWYYMPVSLHKLLIHGPDVISSFMIPIGELSEEALECRHKDIRRFREHNTRKSSRINTNKDLMTMLLLTSDPGLAKFRKVTSSHKELTAEVAEYLVKDISSENLNLSIDSELSDSNEEITEESESD